eukprot:2351468-Amphidinium_carterae.2
MKLGSSKQARVCKRGCSKLFGLDVGSQATERFHVVESNGHREAENTSKPEPKVESKLQSKDNQSDFYSPQIIAEIRALTQVSKTCAGTTRAPI